MVFVCLFCFLKQYKGTHPWNLTTEDGCIGSSMTTTVLALTLFEAIDSYCLNPVVIYITILTKLPMIQRSHLTPTTKEPDVLFMQQMKQHGVLSPSQAGIHQRELQENDWISPFRSSKETVLGTRCSVVRCSSRKLLQDYRVKRLMGVHDQALLLTS